MPERVAIVGAGIVGLAHAWSAAERGHQVTVFERSGAANGASVRNFGMIWPIGQPEEYRSIAVESRRRWLTLGEESGIWTNPCGSLHLAHRADEWDVLQEFYEHQQRSDLSEHLRLLSPAAAMSRSSAINPQGFIGAMYCDLEICVNPVEAIRSIPIWLSRRWNVRFEFDTTIVECHAGRLCTASGRQERFDRVVVCSGHDFETLYPDTFKSLPMRKCKLQMMRTVRQPNNWKLGAHIAKRVNIASLSKLSML